MFAQQWNEIMTKEFWRDFSALPADVTQRAKRAIDRMLQDPWAQELHPEKIQAAEAGVHSCRADDNYRIIWKHIKPNDIVFLLIDKHQEAYRRARRKTFTLTDGLVKVADIVEVGAAPAEALFGLRPTTQRQIGKLFRGYTDREILSWGVPDQLLGNVRALDNVDELPQFEHSTVLPEATYNKMLEVALDIVERPVVPDEKLRESIQRNQGGDDLYRFVDSDEFRQILNRSLEEWMLFLAPHQRIHATREYNGPARLRGVAGSGKTVVALHRARFLARKLSGSNRKVLFLTFGNRLPGVIIHLFNKLAGPDSPEAGAFECLTFHQLCYRIVKDAGTTLAIDEKLCESAIRQALDETRGRFNAPSLFSHPEQYFLDEIKYAIKGRGVCTLNEYLGLDRSGRGTALNPAERQAMFAVYQRYQSLLRLAARYDYDDYILEALKVLQAGEIDPLPYAHVVVDEIQDLNEATMRLIRALIPSGPNDLFLVGDGTQRIYPGGYALANLGIDVAGRSSLLRRNYRNTQEILRLAHAMIENVPVDDMEAGAVPAEVPEFSVRHGDLPVQHNFSTPEAEIDWVGKEIERLQSEATYAPGDIALLYRHTSPYKELIVGRLRERFPIKEISKDSNTYFGDRVKYTTFHSAKGLEFKVVFIVGATDGQFVPRDDWTMDGVVLEDYLAREKRLLYVAMTRARDLLYVTSSRGQPSRFLEAIPKEFWK